MAKCGAEYQYAIKTVSCGGEEGKRVPLSKYTYPINAVTQHDPGAGDMVYWQRGPVGVSSAGSHGTKTIHFKPKALLICQFSHNDVNQNETPDNAQLRVNAAYFAMMTACGNEAEPGPAPTAWGGIGWRARTYDYEKRGGVWQFPDGKTNFSEAFDISQACGTCAEINHDVHQLVAYGIQIRNNGVMFSSGEPGVEFSLPLDTTTCE